MDHNPVYLDHNATSPLDPRVREAMLPWLGDRHGNPSSVHRFGQEAREAVEGARAKVASLLGGEPPEIVFTASGTEANNAVLFHCARTRSAGGLGGRLVISAMEHPSVRLPAEFLEESGVEVVRVPPGSDGVVPAPAVLEAVTDDTFLVSLMLANNEVGTLQPVAEVARACRERGVAVHTDAVQAVGKVPVDVRELGVDYLVLGGHKFHGPYAAALWIRGEGRVGGAAGSGFEPYLLGGSQERRRRAGTEDVPGIVGLGEACRLAAEGLPGRRDHLAALRDLFEAGLERVPGARVHCAASPRLPHTSHVAFPGVEGEGLLIRLDLAGFAVSTGSACSSGAVEPSKTLLAMGLEPEEALASVRVSFGMPNTTDEVERFLGALEREVAELRRLSGDRMEERSPAAAGA